MFHYSLPAQSGTGRLGAKYNWHCIFVVSTRFQKVGVLKMGTTVCRMGMPMDVFVCLVVYHTRCMKQLFNFYLNYTICIIEMVIRVKGLGIDAL